MEKPKWSKKFAAAAPAHRAQAAATAAAEPSTPVPQVPPMFPLRRAGDVRWGNLAAAAVAVSGACGQRRKGKPLCFQASWRMRGRAGAKKHGKRGCAIVTTAYQQYNRFGQGPEKHHYYKRRSLKTSVPSRMAVYTPKQSKAANSERAVLAPPPPESAKLTPAVASSTHASTLFGNAAMSS